MIIYMGNVTVYCVFSISFGSIFVVFFFLAEEGIRDRCVSGVQTGALPIGGY